ncbi:type II toxin-antitoxin system antitoxin SocA domain-containing protein [Salinisphaera sp. SPP-AMP-43]|uniref:Panacea domain-containing protein n=1 Tax=Salinisphaera sp. SPP-AMP-43 TaxID=3121288 RepID=UPI003C6E3E19
MTLSAAQVAKRICERSGWKLSNLEIQKLVYLIHMRYLGRMQKPLIRESFEAWDYGPVEPGLYHRLKAFGSDPVVGVFNSVPDVADEEAANFIDDTYDMLSGFSAPQLVSITHAPHSAWYKNYRRNVRNSLIPREAILEEFKARESARR